MTSWRDYILRLFPIGAYHLVIASDRDNLLADQALQHELKQRGYDILPYVGDSLALRFNYEAQYRQQTGESGVIIAVLGDSSKTRQIPFDILCRGNLFSFGLSDIFANLSDTVLVQLDHEVLDELYFKHSELSSCLGETETKDFLLQALFAIQPKNIQTALDLLQVLVIMHYQEQILPSTLANHVTTILSTKPAFLNCELQSLFTNRTAFFSWLQDHWQTYVSRKSWKAKEHNPSYDTFSFADGLAHPQLRFYLDAFFKKDFLHPIPSQKINIHSTDLEDQEWLKIGVLIDTQIEEVHEILEILNQVESRVIEARTRILSYNDWLSFAPLWAKAILLCQSKNLVEKWLSRWQILQQQVDEAFLDWLQKYYGTLYNQPSVNAPVMLHQVPKYISRVFSQQHETKIALIVLDGIAYDQWLVLQSVLATQLGDSWQFTDGACFAMLPTLTSISRQAIFAGKLPLYFADSLYTTHKESKLWHKFWDESGHNLTSESVAYMNVVGHESDLEVIQSTMNHPRQKVLGLVVNQVDRIMHGMTLGIAGMHTQVRQWAEQGFMQSLLTLLRSYNYRTFITADHGNIDAIGIGNPSERAFADLRGERVRLYGGESLRQTVQANYPEAITWKPNILPADIFPLFAPYRAAFVQAGASIVCHGGISIEEVIVPFVSVEHG
jgi:hypothetical protein